MFLTAQPSKTGVLGLGISFWNPKMKFPSKIVSYGTVVVPQLRSSVCPSDKYFDTNLLSWHVSCTLKLSEAVDRRPQFGPLTDHPCTLKIVH